MSQGQTQRTSNSTLNHSQQTRYTAQMLFRRWASIADDGTALKQHLISVCDRWATLTYIVFIFILS